MFKECTEDKMKILNPEYNSVSIFVDYNDHQLIIVIIISQAVAGITKIKSVFNILNIRAIKELMFTARFGQNFLMSQLGELSKQS